MKVQWIGFDLTIVGEDVRPILTTITWRVNFRPTEEQV
jgi:hypothetical protein